MLRLCLYLLLIVVVGVSCESDSAVVDPTDPGDDPLIISLIVGTAFMRDVDRAYYVVKGEDGNTIDYSSIQNGDSLSVNLPYDKEKIALIIITTDVLGEKWTIDSYLDLPLGELFVLKDTIPLAQHRATMSLTGLNSDIDEIGISRANRQTTVPAGAISNGEEFTFKYFEDNPLTILTAKQGGSVSFQTIMLDDKKVHQIDLSENEYMAPVHSLNSYAPELEHQITLYGLTDAGDSYYLYRNRIFPNSNIENISSPHIFEQFLTAVEIRDPQSAHTQVTRGAIPTEFVQYDPTIDVASNDLQTIQITVDSETTYVHSRWRVPGSNQLTLNVYSGPSISGSYLLNDLPQSILDAEASQDLNGLELNAIESVRISETSYDEMYKELFPNQVLRKPHILRKWVFY